MFSLLVGLNDDVVPHGRLLEYTDDHVRTALGSNLPQMLQRFPALRMPEVRDDRFEQVARVGTITRFRDSTKGHVFTFKPNLNLEPIPSATVQDLADELGVDPDSWEFTRTHWAVKDVDLFEVLLEHQVRQQRGDPDNVHASGAVRFPVDLPRESDLVAVMMPFAPEFDVVYETIRSAAEDAGLRCHRAADIWEHDHIMGDVLSLLWRSQIVVADLTGRNPNVFYEAGLAHALPRRTVLLTQQSSDIPFDLQSIRYLKYGVGTQQRAALRTQLADRLSTLIGQSPA
jgi:hypothetical protein